MLDALLAQLTALREGAGPGVRIAVDLNFNYKAEGFRRIAKKVEPFDLMWLEMDMYEPEALARIRQSTSTTIASLETILGRRALKPYLEAHCADVDVSRTNQGLGCLWVMSSAAETPSVGICFSLR